MAAFKLNADVAKKYDCLFPLNGQKLVFPHGSKHGVENKAAHKLSVEEGDKLAEHGAVNGVFRLKKASGKETAPFFPAKPATKKTRKSGK